MHVFLCNLFGKDTFFYVSTVVDVFIWIFLMAETRLEVWEAPHYSNHFWTICARILHTLCVCSFAYYWPGLSFICACLWKAPLPCGILSVAPKCVMLSTTLCMWIEAKQVLPAYVRIFFQSFIIHSHFSISTNLSIGCDHYHYMNSCQFTWKCRNIFIFWGW